MSINAVPRIQRQRDLGRYPRASDGPGLLEFRQECPELLRGEGSSRQSVACAYAPCCAATITLRAFLAANTPGADAALLWGMGPANIAVSGRYTYRTAERADQGTEVVQKDFDLILCPEEYAHARKIRMITQATRPNGGAQFNRHVNHRGRRYGSSAQIPEFTALPQHPQSRSKQTRTTR